MPEIDDETLTVIAIVLELGGAFALAFTYIKSPRWRPNLSVVLGALTPVLLICAFVHASFAFDSPSSPTDVWWLLAFWPMSLLPFAALAILGAVLSLIPRPTNLGARYVMGLTVAPLGVYCANLLYQAATRSGVA